MSFKHFVKTNRACFALPALLTTSLFVLPASAAGLNKELHDMLPEPIIDSGVISLGAVWETPPTIGIDPNNPSVPVGIAPELAVLLGEVLGVKVEWQNLQWPAQLPAVQSGNVDALFAQVSITAEREKSVVDLVAWKKSTQSILVAAGNPEGITGLDSMCGLKIAVPLGSNQVPRVTKASEQCVADGKEAMDILEYQGANPSIQALRAGTVDGWLNSTADQEAVVAKEPDVFASVLVPENEIATEYGGIAVSKDQPGLTKALEGALKILLEDGSYAAVLDKYSLAPTAISIDEVVVNPITKTPIGEVAS